jgi:hypothetical protein
MGITMLKKWGKASDDVEDSKKEEPKRVAKELISLVFIIPFSYLLVASL